MHEASMISDNEQYEDVQRVSNTMWQRHQKVGKIKCLVPNLRRIQRSAACPRSVTDAAPHGEIPKCSDTPCGGAINGSPQTPRPWETWSRSCEGPPLTWKN